MRNVTGTIHAQVHCWQGSRWNEQSPQIKSSLGISGIRLNDALQGNNKYLSPSALQPISTRLCQSIDIKLWVSGDIMWPPRRHRLSVKFIVRGEPTRIVKEDLLRLSSAKHQHHQFHLWRLCGQRLLESEWPRPGRTGPSTQQTGREETDRHWSRRDDNIWNNDTF